MDWTSSFRSSTDDPDRPTTPDEVVRFMLDGNARFICEAVPDMPALSTVAPAEGETVDSLPKSSPPKQTPFCVVLGCSDARVPSELVFGVKPNQLFIVRVAGNVLGEECLGSIEYAVHSFRDTLHLVLVLGHTGCGAVGAAVDAYLSPTQHDTMAFTRSLRSVVNHLLLAVRSAALSLAEYWGADVADDPGYRTALIELSVYFNAGMTAYQLREELAPEAAKGIRVMYAVFDVATCRVIGPDLDPNTDDNSKLAAAPMHPDDLIAIGREIASSPMVARHLTKTRRQTRYPGGETASKS